MAIDVNELTKLIVMRGTGYTQQEIADKLNLSRKTVENRLRRLKFESEDMGIFTVFLNNLNYMLCVEEKIKESDEVGIQHLDFLNRHCSNDQYVTNAFHDHAILLVYQQQTRCFQRYMLQRKHRNQYKYLNQHSFPI